MNTNNNLVRFLKIVFKKNKLITTIGFAIMVITSIVSLLMPQITKCILDDAIKNNKINLLIRLIVLYVVAIVLTSILNFILEYIHYKMKNEVSIKFKIKLIRHLSKLSGEYYTNISTGNVLNILENDMYVVESLGADLLFSLILNFFTAVMAFVFLIKIRLNLLIIVIAIQYIILYSQSKFTKLIALKNDKLRDSVGDIANLNQEYISNIMNISISKANLKVFISYLKKERIMLKTSMDLSMMFSISILTSSICNGFITVVIYAYGGYEIMKGKMTFGELIAFHQYTGMFVSPCMSIIRSNRQIEQAKTSINRIFTILDEPIKISNNNKGFRCGKKFEGNIVFKNVNFSYDDGHKILNNINLKFYSGEITALVGSSGSGKSTIGKLLFRLWDVSSGNITIDRVDIKEYNLKSIRKNISIVTQDSFLFNDTILKNLIMDKKNIDELFLSNICKVLGIYEFINNLSNGFDTIVGENGVKLSGGQKQRISIARALLSDSKIIIFDEATSALDNISQNEILKNIKVFLKNKTVLVIAHRLSTINNADNIYVLDKGRVVEEGSHKQLVLSKKLYYKLLKESMQKEVG